MRERCARNERSNASGSTYSYTVQYSSARDDAADWMRCGGWRNYTRRRADDLAVGHSGKRGAGGAAVVVEKRAFYFVPFELQLASNAKLNPSYCCCYYGSGFSLETSFDVDPSNYFCWFTVTHLVILSSSQNRPEWKHNIYFLPSWITFFQRRRRDGKEQGESRTTFLFILFPFLPLCTKRAQFRIIHFLASVSEVTTSRLLLWVVARTAAATGAKRSQLNDEVNNSSWWFRSLFKIVVVSSSSFCSFFRLTDGVSHLWAPSFL